MLSLISKLCLIFIIYFILTSTAIELNWLSVQSVYIAYIYYLFYTIFSVIRKWKRLVTKGKFKVIGYVIKWIQSFNLIILSIGWKRSRVQSTVLRNFL